MSGFSGGSGSVNIGGALTDVVRWEITPKINMRDSASMSSGGWDEKTGCLRGWEGNFEVRSYPGNMVGSRIAGTFNTGTGVPGHSGTAGTYLGSCAITDEPVAVPHDDLINWKVNFQGHGTLTCPT